MARRDAAPTLTLAVQYASARPAPSRDRVRRWVQAAIAALDRPAASYAITTRFVDDDEARALNRDFRGRDYATNVLTFPYPDDAVDDLADDAKDDAADGAKDDAADDAGDDPANDAGAIAADLVVCLPVVEREARAQHKDPMDHCAHLVVHGTLHAAGLDHETPADADVMEALERRVLKRFRIADPYA